MMGKRKREGGREREGESMFRSIGLGL